MQDIKTYIRWILLPILGIVWTGIIWLLGWLLISYTFSIGSLLISYIPFIWGAPMWWREIVIGWFQWALLWYFAFLIPYQCAPRHKKIFGIVWASIWSVIWLALPILTIIMMIFWLSSDIHFIEEHVANDTFNLTINIVERLIQCAWFIIWSYIIFQEKRYD